MPTLPYYIRRFRELGLREGAHQGQEIIKRGASRILEKVYDRYLYSDPKESDIMQLCRFSSASELVKHFRTRNALVFFFDEGIDTVLS